MESRTVEFQDCTTQQNVEFEVISSASVDHVVLIATAEGEDRALCSLAVPVPKLNEIAQAMLAALEHSR
jgi:hypothetical protein